MSEPGIPQSTHPCYRQRFAAPPLAGVLRTLWHMREPGALDGPMATPEVLFAPSTSSSSPLVVDREFDKGRERLAVHMIVLDRECARQQLLERFPMMAQVLVARIVRFCGCGAGWALAGEGVNQFRGQQPQCLTGRMPCNGAVSDGPLPRTWLVSVSEVFRTMAKYS